MKKYMILVMVLGLGLSAYAQNLKPSAQAGASVGVSGQGWSNVIAHAFICETADGANTNTLTTSTGLLNPAMLSGGMVINSFAAAAVAGADGTTNVITITAKDAGGNTLAVYGFIECWVGDTAYSAPAPVATEFTVTTGTEVQQITDKAHYLVMTGSDGIAVLTIEDVVARTNALHIVGGGGKVTATTLVWDTP